ncbi:MAG: branched-chain amino acid aminotransferase [Alphaproteobacteria bacterium]|nr:branched-chain amino acid aminotransferase [Alphaproteobacteria bacterium]
MAPNGKSGWSKTWTFLDGDWHEGNVPIMGPRTHAAWLASCVFDGARAFEGVTPDLDLHCARINDSAPKLFLKPLVPHDTWTGLVADGLKKFDPAAAIYIRPMYWAEHGDNVAGVAADPESTRWCLSLYETGKLEASGASITLSPFRRPTIECMPVDAKAGCLYPNNGRALMEARSRGFDSCLMCDMLGNVAELASANVFFAKDGVVHTPAANGTFLAGITRARTIKLLREAGVTVIEGTFRYRDFEHADEIFSAGNYSKVVPITRIGERSLQPGPFYRQARALYWDYAHG